MVSWASWWFLPYTSGTVIDPPPEPPLVDRRFFFRGFSPGSEGSSSVGGASAAGFSTVTVFSPPPHPLAKTNGNANAIAPTVNLNPYMCCLPRTNDFPA